MKILKRLLLTATLLSLILTPTVSATMYFPAGRTSEWVQNDILYYKPACSTTSIYGDGDISISGGTVIEMIWNGLLSFLTPEQAAGVMGNMQSESGFRLAVHESNGHSPSILTDTQSAHGIALIQWSFDRRVNLLNYIQQRNPALIHYFTDRSTYSDISPDAFLATAGQADTAALVSLELSFLKQELESSYRGFFSTSTVEEAATYFLEKVERPKNPYIEYHMARLFQARGYYNQFGGSTTSSSGSIFTPTTSTACVGAVGVGIMRNNGDINSTALQLAWTSRHAWNDPSSAYRAAMEALGIWDGAGGNTDSKARLGGSCDVFVATVMRYSGADPNFPLYLGGQKPYLANNPNYEVVPNIGSTANLRPGDIRIENGGGHIAMVVQRADGSLGIASASHGERSGDVGGYYNDSSAIIYRLRGSQDV